MIHAMLALLCFIGENQTKEAKMSHDNKTLNRQHQTKFAE